MFDLLKRMFGLDNTSGHQVKSTTEVISKELDSIALSIHSLVNKANSEILSLKYVMTTTNDDIITKDCQIKIHEILTRIDAYREVISLIQSDIPSSISPDIETTLNKNT